MKRFKMLAVGVAVLGGLVASKAARADTDVFVSSSGSSSGDVLNLTLNNNTVVSAPLVLQNPAGGSNGKAFTGWYANDGSSSGSGNDNYITGFTGGMTFGDFLVYNLSSVAAAIKSAGGIKAASESVFTFHVNGPITIEVFDVQTPLSTLDSYPTGADGQAIFTDLTNGKIYGTQTYTSANQNHTVTISLDAAFITDFNNAVVTGNATQFAVADGALPLPSPMLGGAMLLGLFGALKLGRRVLA